MERPRPKPRIERVRPKLKEEEPVGYGHPPKHHRFKPGQSGNPRGRPKGRKNVMAEFEDLLSQKVKLRSGGKLTYVPIVRALGLTLVNRALNGGLKEIKTVLGIASASERNQESKRPRGMPVITDNMSLQEAQAVYEETRRIFAEQRQEVEASAKAYAEEIKNSFPIKF